MTSKKSQAKQTIQATSFPFIEVSALVFGTIACRPLGFIRDFPDEGPSARSGRENAAPSGRLPGFEHPGRPNKCMLPYLFDNISLQL